MKSFWQTIPKPFFILAPMEDVTDTVFRRIISSCGRPDIFFTEFTSVEGMFSPGETTVIRRLLFTQEERPLVAQIWGINPHNFYKAAKKLVAMGFDGIDLNMGCPDKGVREKGACSALMNNRTLAQEIIEATKEGAGNAVPVSIKTRIGYKMIDLSWIEFLLTQNVAAISIHARTVSEMSKVPAHWEIFSTIVPMKQKINPQTLLIGNGDIMDKQEGINKAKQYKLDGIMVGRGIFSNPYFFTDNKTIANRSVEEKMSLLLSHVSLWDRTWGKDKHFPTLRKFFKIYANEFPGSHDLRIKLMTTNNSEETIAVVNEFCRGRKLL